MTLGKTHFSDLWRGYCQYFHTKGHSSLDQPGFSKNLCHMAKFTITFNWNLLDGCCCCWTQCRYITQDRSGSVSSLHGILPGGSVVETWICIQTAPGLNPTQGRLRQVEHPGYKKETTCQPNVWNIFYCGDS